MHVCILSVVDIIFPMRSNVPSDFSVLDFLMHKIIAIESRCSEGVCNLQPFCTY